MYVNRVMPHLQEKEVALRQLQQVDKELLPTKGDGSLVITLMTETLRSKDKHKSNIFLLRLLPLL